MTEGVVSPDGDATPSSSPQTPPRRHRLLIGVLAVVAVVVLLHGLVVETFTVPSSSMQPTLWKGDRILVAKVGTGPLRRGEIIVFDGTNVFAEPGTPRSTGFTGLLRDIGDRVGLHPSETLYVKRIIGLPGDRVSVGHDGKLRINGTVQSEPYLPKGMKASNEPFVASVPAGHLFVMGDNRPTSDDSRSHRGDPGGGMVPTSDVVGEVMLRYWPSGSWGTLRS